MLEFKVARRKPEHYNPAKDIMSMIKAVEGGADQSRGASVARDIDGIDARRNLSQVRVEHVAAPTWMGYTGHALIVCCITCE